MTGVGSRHRPRRDWKPVAASVTRPRMSLVLQSFLPFPHSCQGPSPHQQGRDARMIEQCFGGIDVSQDRLDVLLLPQGTGFSVANDEAGWSTLIGRLRGLLLTAIGLEPSGGYERGVLRALLAAGLSVRRINPNRLRQFARARGALAKNDRLDADEERVGPVPCNRDECLVEVVFTACIDHVDHMEFKPELVRRGFNVGDFGLTEGTVGIDEIVGYGVAATHAAAQVFFQRPVRRSEEARSGDVACRRVGSLPGCPPPYHSR